MLNTRSDDIAGSVAQAVALEQAGCEIVRAAIPDKSAIALIPAIKEKISIPLVADIHFDYRLALKQLLPELIRFASIPETSGAWSGCVLW